MTRYHKT